MWCAWVALNQRGSRLTLLSRHYMILGQTCTSDSPRIDKFKSYKLTSCIELFHSLTGPQNLKCYCASLIHLCFFRALFYYLPCCVLISTTPYKYDCPADRGPNLPCRDQTPSCFLLHTLLEKDYSFLLLRTCAMPSSPSHLSPRPEYFRQFWFFHLQLMLEQHPIGLPLRPNPMWFWSLYVVRGDCSATLQLIWLGETPFLAIHLCISFQDAKVSPLELFTFSLVSTFSCCFLTGTIFASAVWFHCQLSFWSSFYFSGFFDLDCRCNPVLTNLPLCLGFSICIVLNISACSFTVPSVYAEPEWQALECSPLQCSTCPSDFNFLVTSFCISIVRFYSALSSLFITLACY